MRQSDLDTCKKLLLDKRRDLLAEMGYIEETHGTTIKEATGDLTHYSYHMADQGTDNMERELAYAQGSKSRRLLYHIDEALRRIEEGTYGKCHVCGRQIPMPRLKAVPHARLCIPCKSLEEEKKAGR